MMKSICKRPSKKHKGQGIVEYAGAIVVAVVIVAAVLGSSPTAVKTMFENIISKISTDLTAKADAAL